MTRLKLFILTLLCSLSVAAAYKVDDIPNVHLQDRSRYVSNPDGVLSSAAQAQADSIISSIWKNTTAEVTMVVINDFDGDDIDTFATKLFEAWGIGKSDKSNGMLILVAKDRRKAVIRTGYGLEGVMPDVTCGRILRNTMFPRFKEGNYDEGVIAALTTVSEVLNNPENVDEILSKQKNDANAKAESNGDTLFYIYLIMCAGLALIMLGLYVEKVLATRKLSDFERYNALDSLKQPALFCSFLGLGLPLVAYIPIVLTMRRLRNKKHICSNCGTRMHRLDEETDNLYLTPAQDKEEQLNSVDYDVWLCPNCNATDILPYVNKKSSYTVCDKCGARACTLTSNRTVVPATTARPGMGERTYQCLNCHNKNITRYTIPKLAAPVVIMGPSGRGGGFGGGGGFSGGSFGGGLTGGGGASGGW